jgi:hypothetical protein
LRRLFCASCAARLMKADVCIWRRLGFRGADCGSVSTVQKLLSHGFIPVLPGSYLCMLTPHFVAWQVLVVTWSTLGGFWVPFWSERAGIADSSSCRCVGSARLWSSSCFTVHDAQVDED